MTKLTQLLQKSGNARCPDKNFVKFTNYKMNLKNQRIEHIPALRNRIAETRDKVGSDTSCLQEMNRVMDCFKQQDFNESKCAKEILSFNICVEKAKVTVEAMKKASSEELGTGGPVGSKKINKLLRMYPQPPAPVKLTHFAGRPMRKPIGHVEQPLRRRTNED